MEMQNSQLHELFSVPVWSTEIPRATEEEFEYIKSMEYIQHLRPNKKLRLTKKTYVIDTEDALSNIKNNIQTAVDHYWHDVINVKQHLGLRTLHSWITRHNIGDFHPWHQDPNTLLSAIYYIRAPENSGKLCFRKDLNYCNLFPNVMEMKYHTKTAFNNREWSLTPKDGLLVVFPAHIEHQVSESMSEEERFALIIDYWPTGKLNDGLDDGDWDQEIY
jgi:uncharacterized protein (TIGR02466 family)